MTNPIPTIIPPEFVTPPIPDPVVIPPAVVDNIPAPAAVEAPVEPVINYILIDNSKSTLLDVVGAANNVSNAVKALKEAMRVATTLGITLNVNLEYDLVKTPTDLYSVAPKTPTGINASVSLPFPLPN